MPRDEAEAQGQHSNYDFPIVIATMPATARQRATAISVATLLFFFALVIAPFASIQIGRVDNFIPVVQTVLSIADLVTATLLFSQYSLQPQSALLVLASGYIFSGSFALLQTFAFPGGYAPAGLIGDGRNSPAWLFVLWHSTFLSAGLIYALSKDVELGPPLDRRSSKTRICLTIVCALVAIVGLTWAVTNGVGYLPKFYTESVTLQTQLGNLVNFAFCSMAATALVILFIRQRTVLDLWLMVTLLASIPNFLVATIASSVRFSVGWYAGRGFALVASCTLLSVLLTEMTFLYSRLASALTLQRRERSNRLMSVEVATAAMAHELRTPLGTIALNASTALKQIRVEAPDLEELDAILEDIESASHRAGMVISSIRSLSARTPIDRRTMTGMEDIARQVLRMVQHDLQINEISVTTEFQDNLPLVHADPTQLQQVVLNLIKNAVDAMNSVAPAGRVLQIGTSLEGISNVLLSVQDSGIGIPPEDRERIFDPFFTTKPAGMGLGLAICRTVIENHGGKLRLTRSDLHGSVIEVALPAGIKNSLHIL
jgi:signal transduction histidine kinase